MNWLTNFVKPKLSALVKRKDVPENLWQNCPSCGNMIHHKDLKENLRVCSTCNHHFRMSADDRMELLFTKEDTIDIELDKISDDPLNFSDKKKPITQELTPAMNCAGTISTLGNFLTIIIKIAKVIGILNAAKLPDISPGDKELPTINKTPDIAKMIDANVINEIVSFKNK